MSAVLSSRGRITGAPALARLRLAGIIEGEAVACGEDGIALFERIRYRLHDGRVFCMAFDLIEVNGGDMPRVMQAAEATLALSCQGTITVC